MRKVINKILKYSARFMAFINYVWPFVVIYSRIIEEVRPKDGKVVQGKPIILALNPQRFLGDLEVLVESKEFRILKVPFDWQCKILALYWNDKVVFPKYYDPEGDVTIIKIQTKLRRFLNSFLSELYKSLKIDCVISAAVNYRHDYDWGLVSSEIDVPYIVLQKENAVAATNLHACRSENMKNRKKFRGDHVVVHNAIMKDIKTLELNWRNKNIDEEILLEKLNSLEINWITYEDILIEEFGLPADFSLVKTILGWGENPIQEIKDKFNEIADNITKEIANN